MLESNPWDTTFSHLPSEPGKGGELNRFPAHGRMSVVAGHGRAPEL